MSEEAPPEPDRIEGAPHPRETARLFGQDAAEAAFLEAYNGGRLHHAWLLAGPRGVGKATLAWRIARFLLATPERDGDGLFGDTPPLPESLEIAPEHPVARRIMAGSEPGLKLIRRGGVGKNEQERARAFLEGKFSKDIRVDEVRELTPFLSLSAIEGGRRVVIVDIADEMNTHAANALLKMLEEPPAKTTLLLVSHQPSKLLPTIRSRCRELRLAPLGPEAMTAALAQANVYPEPGSEAALAVLSGGSVGEAVRLINLGGLKIYADLVSLMGTLPRLERPRALTLAGEAAARGAGATFDLMIGLIEMFLARLARAGALGASEAEGAPGEAALLTRLSPDAHHARKWATAADALGERMRHGQSVNLDPAALILDTILKIRDTAAG
ncbi:DNA polymerase III subunit delta' [Aquicoccus sp. G2-2]|uniref:DNA polymerase III subunit delta' n=1 Tax=Aquicoccus sp. G2-2 TaxID=3092120 RepID=UPI002ADFCA78|nr:DNA polymerase III subunit delta' [Aquicoccus sp. G2-2]MEA1112136.1 DNA polymerase III subunit delta' [Aquicoccus sp. G2-2]